MKDNKAQRVIDGKIPELIGDYERMDNAKDFDELFWKFGCQLGAQVGLQVGFKSTSNFTQISSSFPKGSWSLLGSILEAFWAPKSKSKTVLR